MTTEAPTNALALILKSNDIALDVGLPIVEAFSPFFDAAAKLVREKPAINAVAPTATDVKLAKTLRLAMKEARCEGEGVRKEKKAVYLRMGRAIDDIQRKIVGMADPYEREMEEVETYAARVEAARKEELRGARVLALQKFPVDPALYALADMTEAQFRDLVVGLDAVEAKKIADAAEAAAAAAELAEMEREMEAQREEEKRLEREAQAKAMAEQKRKNKELADEIRAQEKRAQQERAAAEEQRRIERQAADALARKESEARKKAEDELAAVRAAEKAKADAEAKARKKAAAAPDRDKIIALAAALRAIPLPDMACEDGKIAMGQIEDRIMGLANFIEQEGRAL